MKTKKKTSAQSNVTLLDFFPAVPTETQNPKGKLRADGSKPRGGGVSVKKRELEVIVIDSDSEDDSGGVEVVAFATTAPSNMKRRKLAGETSSSSRRSATSVSKSSLKLENATTIGEWRAFELLGGPASTSKMTFGDPVLLQPGAVPVTLDSDASSSSSSLNGYTDAPIAKNRAQNEPQSYAASDSDHEVISKCIAGGNGPNSSLTKMEVDIDLTLDNWEMGDDEYYHTTLFLDHSDPEPLPKESYTPPEEAESGLPSLINPNDAFSLLMSGYKENEAWKEADLAEDRTFRPNKSNGNRRRAPFYKVMQGMPIAVDAFKYGCIPEVTAYFLTHAHSDHYTNLSSTWKHGPIYCSEGTANLIIHMLSVDPKWVHALPMDTPTPIPNTGGVRVTLIEANHCPGSSLFFFEGPQTVNAGDTTFKSSHVGSGRVFRYLHCGDFRASPRHVLHPAVKGKVIDHIYLDTTYLDPKYTFPPQALVVSACANLASKLASTTPHTTTADGGVFASWLNPTSSSSKGPPMNKTKDPPKPVLFIIGTYSIGKERIVKAVAKALNTKIYCDKRKASILLCQADPDLASLLTPSPTDAQVHLLPLGMITSDKLPAYLDKFKATFSKVVAFRPTGWTYVQPSGTDQLPSINAILTRTVQKPFTFQDLKPSKQSTSTLQLYPVPYSEHSSFYELTCFAMSLNWTKMVATVNVGNEKSRGKMAKWFAKWEAERKKRGQVEIIAHRHLDYW